MNSRIAIAAAGGFAVVAVLAAASAITLLHPAPTRDFGAEAASMRPPAAHPRDIVAPVTASLFAGTFTSTTQNVWPDRIAIPAIGLDMAVTALGLAPDGSMALNDRADTAAWYKYGAVPGEREEAALIAAHVSSVVDGVGPFSRLTELRQGDTVTVTMSDGSEQPFTVVKRQRISKETVDYNAITAESAGMLILVTCGGTWDPQTRHYDDNVIVWAASLVP